MGIEEISRIQRAIPQEFIGIPVELIRARAGDGVNDSARGPSILGRIVAGNDRELLNRVYTQRCAQHTSRSSVRIVIEADPVESIVILYWFASTNRELIPESAFAAVGTATGTKLGQHGANTRLQIGQIRPTSSVKRQLADRSRIDNASDG